MWWCKQRTRKSSKFVENFKNLWNSEFWYNFGSDINLVPKILLVARISKYLIQSQTGTKIFRRACGSCSFQPLHLLSGYNHQYGLYLVRHPNSKAEKICSRQDSNWGPPPRSSNQNDALDQHFSTTGTGPVNGIRKFANGTRNVWLLTFLLTRMVKTSFIDCVWVLNSLGL